MFSLNDTNRTGFNERYSGRFSVRDELLDHSWIELLKQKDDDLGFISN